MAMLGVEVRDGRAEAAPELSCIEARDVHWRESGKSKKAVRFDNVVWFESIRAEGAQRETASFRRTSRTRRAARELLSQGETSGTFACREHGAAGPGMMGTEQIQAVAADVIGNCAMKSGLADKRAKLADIDSISALVGGGVNDENDYEVDGEIGEEEQLVCEAIGSAAEDAAEDKRASDCVSECVSECVDWFGCRKHRIGDRKPSDQCTIGNASSRCGEQLDYDDVPRSDGDEAIRDRRCTGVGCGEIMRGHILRGGRYIRGRCKE